MEHRSLEHMILPPDVRKLLADAPSVLCANRIEDLEALACGGRENREWQVKYTLPDGEEVHEATVVRVKNGIAVNYTDPYMRRRDPDCMWIGDDRPSDKPRYADRFGHPFAELRAETLDWLSRQDLAVFAFEPGHMSIGMTGLAICPANAGFFAFGLGLLQGVVNLENRDEPFRPTFIIFVAPTFRHTHFGGKQAVVHNRVDVHEMFSYNLYTGPSAKKGVYGALLSQGAREKWVTVHASCVLVRTPYDNMVTFMHEGASGSGKSEMLQQPHRLPDGRLLLGRNLVTGEERYLEIPRTCDLHPVCDDMGLCHPDFQENDGRLWLTDAEDAWFVRVDHITKYGTDHDLERMTIAPARPLLFLSIDAVPNGTALIWDHVEDEPGVPCPNPRVILPRDIVPGVVEGRVPVDIRSFGVRTPPCTATAPSYGIIGLFHILPPALAWLWRLASPRGHHNPSVVQSEEMGSEGVGSYWPFATGLRVEQANLLLEQFVRNKRMRHVLVPNQHIGVWRTGFMPQWVARDYLARRGHAKFQSDQCRPARCHLLGYALQSIRIEGTTIPGWLFQVEQQPEVGTEAYDEGARILTEFFRKQVQKFLKNSLDELGRKIIDCFLANGTVEEYEKLIPVSDGVY